ncbi:hypothetical protein Bhyg_02147 [Pseudolycoriella hygida]|uniref:Uncharacterized protein n=1 Tax=Pseudolycoriella hygida TaxID=35572 RepID=A0A9Q0NBC5_9DIPT|nr:hypothetical protein Bhyg_02147 [Pseudolycoriella hygida]
MIVVPLTFVGLIFVSGILSAIQSYFTRPIRQPQIETIKDLYNSKLLIYNVFEDWTNSSLEALTSQIEDGDWVSRFQLYPSGEFHTQIDYFIAPTTIAFVEEVSIANSLVNVQKQLNTATGYHISQIRMSTRANVYEVNKDFPLINHFNQIIYWTAESGLYDFWKRNRFSRREKYLVHLNKNSNITRNRVQIDNDSSVVSTFIVWGEIPAGVLHAATLAKNETLPVKSKARYFKALECFENWRSMGVHVSTEDVLLGYFHGFSENFEPSSLWCYYSMLKGTIRTQFDIDISKTRLLTSFLNRGYKPVKASVFTEYDMASLLEPHHYTGHTLRRSSATVFVNSGANMDSLKRFADWRSTAVAAKSFCRQTKSGELITSSIFYDENIVNDVVTGSIDCAEMIEADLLGWKTSYLRSAISIGRNEEQSQVNICLLVV